MRISDWSSDVCSSDLLLLLVVSVALPETHPPHLRLSLAPRRLVRDYWAIFANPRFQRLAASGAFNFSSLFLYIASAPAFVMDLMDLNERQFGWFFIPMIGGMMLGAYNSGRMAGRISGARLADIEIGRAHVSTPVHNVP